MDDAGGEDETLLAPAKRDIGIGSDQTKLDLESVANTEDKTSYKGGRRNR